MSELRVPYALAVLHREVNVGGLHSIPESVEDLQAFFEPYRHVEGQRVNIEGGGVVVLVEADFPGQHFLEADGGNLVVLDCLDLLVSRKHQYELLGGNYADVQDLFGKQHGVEDLLDGRSQCFYQRVVQQQVEHDRENFPWIQLVVAHVLFDDFAFPFFLQELRFNRDGEIVLIIFFNLHGDTDGHGLSCKIHADDLVQEGTGKFDGFETWRLSGNRADLHESKLLQVLIPYQDVVLVGTYAGRSSWNNNFLSCLPCCLVGA